MDGALRFEEPLGSLEFHFFIHYTSTPSRMVRLHCVQYPFCQNGQIRGRLPLPKYRIVSCPKTLVNAPVATHIYPTIASSFQLILTCPSLPQLPRPLLRFFFLTSCCHPQSPRLGWSRVHRWRHPQAARLPRRQRHGHLRALPAHPHHRLLRRPPAARDPLAVRHLPDRRDLPGLLPGYPHLPGLWRLLPVPEPHVLPVRPVRPWLLLTSQRRPALHALLARLGAARHHVHRLRRLRARVGLSPPGHPEL